MSCVRKYLKNCDNFCDLKPCRFEDVVWIWLRLRRTYIHGSSSTIQVMCPAKHHENKFEILIIPIVYHVHLHGLDKLSVIKLFEGKRHLSRSRSLEESQITITIKRQYGSNKQYLNYAGFNSSQHLIERDA